MTPERPNTSPLKAPKKPQGIDEEVFIEIENMITICILATPSAEAMKTIERGLKAVRNKLEKH